MESGLLTKRNNGKELMTGCRNIRASVVTQLEGRSFFTNFFMLDPVSGNGMSFLRIEETKSKYSPPSLQRLCSLGQPDIFRHFRVGSRWRRPCGNSSMRGHQWISKCSREMSPSIPSGSTTKLLQPPISIFSSDAGNGGISSKQSHLPISKLCSRGSGRISSIDDPFPSSLLQFQITRVCR